MYRLIFNELSSIIGPQSILKIEILSDVLCTIPLDNLEQLNISDIRDIIRSCDDRYIFENFDELVTKRLSRECQICTGEYPNSYMQEMFLCNDACCLDCVKNYYRGVIADITDVKSLNRLTCIINPVEITEEVKLNFFNWLGTKVKKENLSKKTVFEEYMNLVKSMVYR